MILESKYKPTFWLRNGHISTIFTSLFRKHHIVNYERKRIKTPDNDFLDLDCLFQNNQEKLAIIFHGLESDTQQDYMTGMAKMLFEQGFSIIALNFRGCSGEKNNLYSSYHGGHTTDIRYLIKKYESEFNKIYLIGFSLGGNAMLKYLGEEATNISTKLKKAIAISVPCDFFGSALKIIYKPNNFIYQYRFLKKLKTKLLDKAPLYPKQLSVNEIKKVKTLEEFDDYYTAPAHGFKNGRDYWHYASTLDNLPHIKVPTLLINALDDPFLSENCFPYKIAKEHSFLDLETPKYGGHVGFYQSKPLLWHEERALEFLGKS